jgi:NADPH:quinone reductase-like Zn-dependent oxidoreductase
MRLRRCKGRRCRTKRNHAGAIKPIVAKTFPLAEAADALRYLVEGRPFGRVVITI